MPEIEDTAFKIIASFEDHYFEKEQRAVFIALFNRYLPVSDPLGEMEQYDAIVTLGYKHRDEFDQMVKELKERSLIS